MATPPFLPNQQPGQSDLQQMMARFNPQAAGPMTTTAPDVRPIQAPQANIQPMRPMQQADNLSPAGQQSRQIQNIAAGVQNLASAISNKMQERKQRETQGVFNRYADSVKGIQDSQAQAQQGMQAIRQAQQEMIQARQAGDPQAESAARQKMMEAQQMFTTAQESLKSNQTNLDDMFNGPKGEKHAKMIQKGYGIDDKNKDTPERQAAIASVKKNLGVGGPAANLISRMPQTAQLTPQARQQQMGREAGITSAPATQGQILKAETDAAKMQNQQAMQAENRKAQFVKSMPQMQAAGFDFAKDDKGNPQFDDKGFPIVKPMTQEEIKKNPQLALKQNLMQSTIDYNKAKEDLAMNPNNPINQIRAMNAEAAMKRANAVAQVTSAGSTDAMAKLVASDQMALSQVPVKARGEVVRKATEIKPTFDAQQNDSEFKATQATERDFAAGKAASNVRSLNTALSHLHRLEEANQALNSGDLTALNKMANAYGKQTGDDKQAVFDAVATAVVGELGTTFKGAAATDPEIHALRESLDKSFSKGVNSSVIKADAELIGGRLNALQSQYDEGTKHKGTKKLLNSESEGILKGFGLDATGHKPKEPATGSPEADPMGILK
jgi:hypothetical protein